VGEHRRLKLNSWGHLREGKQGSILSQKKGSISVISTPFYEIIMPR
jgi:hypothetical protein